MHDYIDTYCWLYIRGRMREVGLVLTNVDVALLTLFSRELTNNNIKLDVFSCPVKYCNNCIKKANDENWYAFFDAGTLTYDHSDVILRIEEKYPKEEWGAEIRRQIK